MIDDLDRSIKNLLETRLDPMLKKDIEISFETPDDKFGPSSMAINVFLYDVRENQELRSNDWSLSVENHVPGARRVPPVRVDCSYLVTAWAGDIQAEHHLLGEVMTFLSRYPHLPREVLEGQLLKQELPLPSAALQPGRLQSVAEFWQALGGKPKAAFDYTVTIAVPSQVIEPETPVGIVKERQFTVADKKQLEEEAARQAREDRRPDRSNADAPNANTNVVHFKDSERNASAGDRAQRQRGRE